MTDLRLALPDARDLDHGRTPGSDRSQSLHRIYPPQITFGHVQSRVPELALQAVERDAVPRAHVVATDHNVAIERGQGYIFERPLWGRSV